MWYLGTGLKVQEGVGRKKVGVGQKKACNKLGAGYE